jgi:hypothetical protein
VTETKQPSRVHRGIRGWIKMATLLATAVVTVACNEPHFLIPAPTLRGVTIPLPPPSYAEDVLISIDVEGSVPQGFEGPGTRAFLYEKGTGRGYFVFTDESTYTISDVLVDINDNCLENWFVDGMDGEESTAVDYKVVLQEGADACSGTTCSAMDDVGACLCLEKWTVGC